MHARAHTENRTRGRVDIQHMAIMVDNDDAIIDVFHYGQNGDVGVRQATLQAVSLCGVFEHVFLVLNTYVVYADVCLGTSSDSCDAPVLARLGS